MFFSQNCRLRSWTKKIGNLRYQVHTHPTMLESLFLVIFFLKKKETNTHFLIRGPSKSTTRHRDLPIWSKWKKQNHFQKPNLSPISMSLIMYVYKTMSLYITEYLHLNSWAYENIMHIIKLYYPIISLLSTQNTECSAQTIPTCNNTYHKWTYYVPYKIKTHTQW